MNLYILRSRYGPVSGAVSADCGSLPCRAVRSEADWAAASGNARRRRDAAFLAQIMRRFATLPTLLADKGYASFQAGKWWEGSYENGGFTEGMSAGWHENDWGEADGSENVASGHPDLTSRFMEAIATWKNYIVSSTE